MFSQTSNRPALIREITTPYFGRFLQQIIEPGIDQQLYGPLMECLHRLIPLFPSSTRSYASAIKTMTMAILTDPMRSTRLDTVAAAVLVDLHLTAAKDAQGSQWTADFFAIVARMHAILNASLSVLNEGRRVKKHQNRGC